MPNPLVLIQEAIITTLTNEMNNLGTNPSGRLQLVKTVGKAWVNAIPGGAYPYVGIVPVREVRSTATVGIRSRDYETTWHVLCAAKSTTSLEDAYTRLHNVVNDGNGNGVGEILEDPANFTLGAGINQLVLTRVEQVDFFDDLLTDKQSGTSSFVAYAIIQFMTKARVSLASAIH